MLLSLASLGLSPLGAQGRDLPSVKIQDDSALRSAIAPLWFTAPPAQVLGYRPSVQTLPGGGRVQIRSEDGGSEFLVILARELTDPAGTRLYGIYPGWAQGSWALSRRKDTGEASRIRIFLRSDPNLYVQFRPLGNDRSQMDVVAYDAYLVNSLTIPVSMERLLTLPVEEALRLAGPGFPRRYFDPSLGSYGDSINFISLVREGLRELEFIDDGAVDETGRYVYIETLEAQRGPGGLNCSGFAKWVVDGLLYPVTGSLLPIGPLKAPFGQRGSNFTNPWEELRDPFFGLDWTRNLAAQANRVLRSPDFARIEEFEVRFAPFSAVLQHDRSGVTTRAYPGFLLNAGFGVEGLRPLLYCLAVNEPGRIYLASVNNEVYAPTTAENLRGLPHLRQYFHVAVLVPYFNEYGNFQIAVFESAAETSFAAFEGRYPGHYVNLVRIPVDGIFSSPTGNQLLVSGN
jgi:hypothetical protein